MKNTKVSSFSRNPLNGRKIWLGAVTIMAMASTALAVHQGAVPNAAAKAVALKVGAKAPDSVLLSLDGKPQRLKSVLGGKPTVLIFYRGSWCPYCNLHLADLQSVEEQIRKLGFQIVAISPDKPADLSTMMDKHQLTYRLYSDSKAVALKKFGVAFRVDDQTFEKMRENYKVDLEKASGETHHILPVPSVFVIDRTGKIVYVHADPDFKVRMKGEEVLAVAKRFAGSNLPVTPKSGK